jgi:hypothetical protein
MFKWYSFLSNPNAYLRNDIQVSNSSTFYDRVFRMKVIFRQNVSREKLPKALPYKKAHKMLMKLTLGKLEIG